MLSNITVKGTRVVKQIACVRPYSAWSQTLSFSSPESDFSHSTISQEADASIPTWSNSLSYTSPEADFASSCDSSPTCISEADVWSGSISFASPEADFTVEPDAVDWEWSQQLSFASPESDFQSSSLPEPSQVPLEHDSASVLQTSPIMGLAISSPESAVGFLHTNQVLNPQQMYQLHEAREENCDGLDLPRTLQDAFSDSDPRAIVVTDAQAPFRIVDVNEAWVGLCGYTKEEVRHHSLNMIQGPETSQVALHLMIQRLLAGQATSFLVTNYTKMGRKFYNRVRAGPIFDANDKITHFVGILEEVTERPNFFQVARL